MTARIVIHAGFHKTGTSSVQAMIHANRRVLERQVRCYLKPQIEPLTEAARAFSIDPAPGTMLDIADAATSFLDTLDPKDERGILVSSEDLSGHLPGRRGLDRYDAAALIMAQLADCIRKRFGPDVPLTFYFSTRGQAEWLRSSYWQNLRSTRLDLDYDTYSAQIAAAADLPAVLHDVGDAVAPGAEVKAQALETSGTTEHGPLTPLLDLMRIPAVTRRKLRVLPPENVQPDLGMTAVFLELNRSGLKDKYLREAKKHLRQMANKQLEQS